MQTERKKIHTHTHTHTHAHTHTHTHTHRNKQAWNKILTQVSTNFYSVQYNNFLAKLDCIRNVF